MSGPVFALTVGFRAALRGIEHASRVSINRIAGLI